MTKTILCVDPGTRYCGIAVFKGEKIIVSMVRVLLSTGPSRERLEEVRRVFSSLIIKYAPGVLVIEEPLSFWTEQSRFLSAIIAEIKHFAKKEKIKIYGFSPLIVRKTICGYEWVSKKDVAEKVSLIYPELEKYLKQDQKADSPELKNCLNQNQRSDHSKLKILLDRNKQDNEWKLRKKYWGHMFDAVGLGICYLKKIGRIRLGGN